jgi:transcriptional regulator with XRE-family HTH domain
MGRDTVPGLAAILRAAREEAGLSQQEAADKSGVHAVSIARFETEVRGPSVATLYKLAAAYGVTVCDLLPEHAPPSKKKGKKK